MGRNEYSAKCLQHNGSAVWLDSELSSNYDMVYRFLVGASAVITSQRDLACVTFNRRDRTHGRKTKAKSKTSNVAAPDYGATTGYEAELWPMADALRGSMCCA